MKIIGVIIVMIASWGYGSGLIHRLNQHQKQLFSLRELLDLFLGEIQYGKAPLQEACLQIGERLPDPFREVLHSISEEISKKNYQSFEWVWREQFQLREKEFYFTEQEMEVLLGIGKNLGYLDVDAQIRHLQLYQREVDELLERMQRTAKEKKKVYRSVSLMIGAMVILLFV
ncbi:MAG: stage III sporulation protein AB [Eubacterium sp.]|nr:stage III sporulation protein AB [Eubacterium sp.]